MSDMSGAQPPASAAARVLVTRSSVAAGKGATHQHQAGSGGSVAEAALKLAASKQPPQEHVTLYRLAAEANRNLTGEPQAPLPCAMPPHRTAQHGTAQHHTPNHAAPTTHHTNHQVLRRRRRAT
jgi:hypothetical protein